MELNEQQVMVLRGFTGVVALTLNNVFVNTHAATISQMCRDGLVYLAVSEYRITRAGRDALAAYEAQQVSDAPQQPDEVAALKARIAALEADNARKDTQIASLKQAVIRGGDACVILKSRVEGLQTKLDTSRAATDAAVHQYEALEAELAQARENAAALERAVKEERALYNGSMDAFNGLISVIDLLLLDAMPDYPADVMDVETGIARLVARYLAARQARDELLAACAGIAATADQYPRLQSDTIIATITEMALVTPADGYLTFGAFRAVAAAYRKWKAE